MEKPEARAGLERFELSENHLSIPHGCWKGWVFIGHMLPDEETGEEVEQFHAERCRRCAEACSNDRQHQEKRHG